MLSYYKSPLISLFSKVQALNADPQNIVLCLEVQETLIRKITYVERKIRNIKRRTENNRRRLRTSTPRLTKTESIEVKEDIDYCRYLIEQFQSLLIILREIGDAVAFTYIDKWNIKPMAFKESPGFISGKKGARLERKILRAAFAAGAIVILNDLTNCLRYGDITVPKHGQFMIIEAKSGKRHKLDERGQRQFEEARNITTYLHTDKTQKLYKKEGPVVRAPLQSKERHHRGKLNKVIADALNKGVSYVKAESGLFYYAATRLDEESLNKIAEKCNSQPIAACLNFMDNTAYYPFTLSISNPTALYEFYKGRLNIIVFVNPVVVREICSARGFDVEFFTDEDCAIKLVHPNSTADDEYSIRVGRHIFGRVFAEFLSLEWFLNEMMDAADIAPSFLFEADEA